MEKKKIKVAILSISSLLMISMTASAILADIQVYFEGVDPSLISMVLTIPALMGLVFAFARGRCRCGCRRRIWLFLGCSAA